jgi:hypothetical protein
MIGRRFWSRSAQARAGGGSPKPLSLSGQIKPLPPQRSAPELLDPRQIDQDALRRRLDWSILYRQHLTTGSNSSLLPLGPRSCRIVPAWPNPRLAQRSRPKSPSEQNMNIFYIIGVVVVIVVVAGFLGLHV